MAQTVVAAGAVGLQITRGEAPKSRAAGMFVDMFMQLYHEGKLNAIPFCVALYWAAQAGAEGQARARGLASGKPSGHYQRHLDTAFGFKAKGMYNYA